MRQQIKNDNMEEAEISEAEQTELFRNFFPVE